MIVAPNYMRSFMNKVVFDDLNFIFAQTQSIMSEFRDAKIFCTGCTGFIGCWLLSSFLKANSELSLNARLTVLTRSPGLFEARFPDLVNASSVNVLKGDIRDLDLDKCDSDYTHIIHAAAQVSLSSNVSEPLQTFNSMAIGTQKVMRLAKRCNVKKVLYLSSGAVYGSQPGHIIKVPENYLGGSDLTNVNSAYAEGKRFSEHLGILNAKENNFEFKIARCFAFSGPFLPLDKHFAVGNFVRDAIQKRRIIIQGDGTPFRSYQYVSDLIIWLWHIFVKGANARPYNVGSDNSVSILELAKTVASVCDYPVDIEIIKPRGASDKSQVSRYVPCVDRAKFELGLDNLVSLDVGVERMMGWAVDFFARKTMDSLTSIQ